MKLFKSKTDTQEDVQTNEKDTAIVSKVQQLYDKSCSSKNHLVAKWKENYKAYTGELFKRNSSLRNRGNAIPNHIFATVETVKPIMLTNPPKNVVLPTKEDDFPKAEALSEALEYEWDRTKLMSKLYNQLTPGLVYGTFIFGLFWDGKTNHNIGNVVLKAISPFNFFIDPMAETIDEAEYVMYATYKTFGEIAKAYPDKRLNLERNKTNNLDETLTFGKDTNNVSDQLLYIECYMRDYSQEVTIEEVDGQKVKTNKRKYPKGRRVIIAGDTLLYDGENPYNDGKFPFVAWKCYDMPGTFWGLSEVEQLISVQKEICSLYNNIIDNAHCTANSPWVVDKNCGIAKGSLTNEKGLVVRKNPGTEVRRETPPSMPAYVQQCASDLKYDIQVISGVYDATRGERPASVTSGTAIQALQESSQGRIKLKTQKLELFLTELGQMWLSRIQQFWVVDRQIRIIGSKYQPNSGQHMLGGQPVSFRTIARDEVDGDFDVKIKTGSTMPVNRSARFEDMLKLAQLPAEDGKPFVDRRAVLEYSEFDNADDIIERFNKSNMQDQINKEAQMEQQNQMQMQQQVLNNQLNMQAQKQQQQADMQSQMQQAMLQAGMQQNASEGDFEGNKGNSGKKSLQDEEKDVKSKSNEIPKGLIIGKDGTQELDLDNMTVQDVINFLQTIKDPMELRALVEKYPRIGDFLQIVDQVVDGGNM